MYSIALKKNQYPTYILTDQNSGARAEVVPERGGIITHWQINDTPLLYFDADRFKDPSLSVRGGIPILFPICGNLPNDTYTLGGEPQGQAYQLKQHGFARDLPWAVSDRTVADDNDPSGGGAILKLTLESNDATRARYPFDFALNFTYRLKGQQLFLEQHFTNTGQKPMPFSTGLHPYFQVNNDAKSQLNLNLPATQYINHLTQTEQPYDGTLDWSADEIDIALRPVSAQQASVSDPSKNVSLTLSYDAAYTTLVFWAVKGKNYYCLEPWSAPRNALNTGTDLITLAPGERKTLTVALSATLA
ncbi:MAG: aldose epimerase [Cyanobacteria bacterium J06649_5]